MSAFRHPLILTAIALFIGTLANWLLRRNYKPHAANLWLIAATFAFLIAAHLGLQIFSPVLTSRQLAQAIAPELKPSDLIVIHGEYEAASTLGFYLHRPNDESDPSTSSKAAAPTSGTAASSPTPPASSKTPSPSASNGHDPAASSSGRTSANPPPRSPAASTSSPKAEAKRSSATSPTPTER